MNDDGDDDGDDDLFVLEVLSRVRTMSYDNKGNTYRIALFHISEKVRILRQHVISISLIILKASIVLLEDINSA